jgi:MFS family permease
MPSFGAPSIYGPGIGLFLIALGTGGIKPCVAALGGNQFKPDQKRWLENFFSTFYMCINIGSLLSTIITPFLRNDVKCFDNDCYPLAFGVPTIFMLFSIIFFVCGTPFYNRDDEKKKKNNVILQTIGCFYRGLLNKLKNTFKDKKEKQKRHWLDHADDVYDVNVISDVKRLTKILVVFLPLPIFWALYDQQGSRWTLQAQQLNGRIGPFTIKPDQFQSINPILVVCFVPIFDLFVYPLFKKCGLLKNLLQRMSIGLILTILSFLIAACLEWKMNQVSMKLNPIDRIKVLNLSPCHLKLKSDFDNVSLNSIIYRNETESNELEFVVNDINHLPKAFLNKKIKVTLATLNDTIDSKCSLPISWYDEIDLNSQKMPATLIFAWNEEEETMKYQFLEYDLKDPDIGMSQIRFLIMVYPYKRLEVIYFFFNKFYFFYSLQGQRQSRKLSFKCNTQ